MRTLVITWMNGTQETHRAQKWDIEDGVLAMFSPNDVSLPDRYIVLANVRSWTAST